MGKKLLCQLHQGPTEGHRGRVQGRSPIAQLPFPQGLSKPRQIPAQVEKKEDGGASSLVPPSQVWGPPSSDSHTSNSQPWQAKALLQPQVK